MKTTTSIRIYAAGSIEKNDWRGVREDGSDAYGEHGIDGLECEEKILRRVFGCAIIYVGPWFVSCDHGCYHGPNTHGTVPTKGYDCMGAEDAPLSGRQRKVLRNSCTQIQKADVVYARIDKPDAFGTFAEIGYAAALGKAICLDIAPSVDFSSDLWFLIHMAIASPVDQDHIEAIPWWICRPESVAEYRSELEWRAMPLDIYEDGEHGCLG